MSELLRHAMKSTKLASDAVRALERANYRIDELEAQLKATLEREAETQRRNDARAEAAEARKA